MAYTKLISTPEAVWFSSVPSNWRATKMRELFSERNIKVSDKDYPALSVGKMGVVPQLDTAVKTDNGDKRKLICKGDFAINSRSDRKGAGGISVYEGSASLIITVLKPHHKLNGRFYHYLLRSHYFTEEFYRNGHGLVSDLWTTKWDEMRNIYIPVPPRDEQDQIVRYLDWKVARINKLIHGKVKLLSAIKNRRQTQLTQIVCGGLEKYVRRKDTGVSWIGSIPEHWKCIPLKRCATIHAGITLGKQYPSNLKLVEVPYLRVANVQNGYVDIHNIATLHVTKEEAKKHQLKQGCVLMTEGGDRDKLGRGCVWDGSIANCIHQNHIFAVSTDDTLLFNKWLEYVSASDIGRTYFDITAIKTTNLACTNTEKVMAFAIPLPPREEQTFIVHELNSLFEKYEVLLKRIEKQISLLREYRTRLISDVVTGQLDVRGIAVPDFVPEEDAEAEQESDEETEAEEDAQ